MYFDELKFGMTVDITAKGCDGADTIIMTTEKRHLRLSSKMAFFCSYQSETLTAKPPLKK